MAIKVRVILYLVISATYFMYQVIRYNVNISVVAIAHAETNMTAKTDNRALILGSFYWFCWITELYGGLILGKFGCRGLLSVSILINAVSSFLFPAAYYFHPVCAAVLRAIQGLALGILWPAIAWLTAKWIPKTERSKFMTSYHGLSLGISFTNLTGGLIIDRFGWPFVFHGTGIMCIIFVVLWWPNVYDTPQKHPRISKEELEYIEKHIVPSDNENKVSHPTPWLEIAKSMPFWALNLMFFAMHWFNVTLATQTPAYFDTVHSVNIKMNGYLTSLPDLAKIVSGTLSPLAVDCMVNKKIISLSASRKLSGVVTLMGPAVFLAFLAYYGNESISVAAILIFLAVAMSGCGSSAIMANIIDISPNHAGTIMGILKTLTILSGVLSPVATQALLNNDKNNWYLVFILCIVLMTCVSIFYVIYCSTDVQPWDCLPKNSEYIEENKDLLELKLKIHELDKNVDKDRQN